MKKKKINYGEAILEGFKYLLNNHPDVLVIGQGLWSPWYVGNTMTDLEKEFGKERIIDTPVSESAVTGAALGASISGLRPIVVHPRIDFMMYAIDAVVNEAAKWSYMFGGQANPHLTIRAIINRGGEQGAQHSQSLQSWFAHIPGLRVVMPYSVKDARDLFIASVLNDDPVIFIDDRWLYDETEIVSAPEELILSKQEPKIISEGNDLTIVSSGFSTKLAIEVNEILHKQKISAEVVDLRILSPLKSNIIFNSLRKTKRLVVIDGAWKSCGIAAEIISQACEELDPGELLSKPLRLCLPDTPAPTSSKIENLYYPDSEFLASNIISNINN